MRDTAARRGAIGGLLLTALAACQQQPSARYLTEVRLIENRIDDYRGVLTTTDDIPGKLQALIEAEPRQPHAYSAAAQYLTYVGQGKKWPGRGKDSVTAADSLLDDAMRLDPHYCPVYAVRGQLRVAWDRTDEALEAVAAARAFGCDDARLGVVRGRALLAKKQYDDAEQEFKTVFDAGPGETSHTRMTWSSAAFEYCRLLVAGEHYDEARKQLGRWQDAGLVYDPWAQTNQAYLLALLGDFDQARAAAKAALTIADLPNAHRVLGAASYGAAWTLEAQAKGASREATDLRAEARENLPDEGLALKMLGGMACCQSDAMKAVMAKRSDALSGAVDTHRQ